MEWENIDWDVQKPFDLFLNLTDSIKWPAIRSHIGRRMAGLTRLELATFRVTGGRSNQTELQPQSTIFHFNMYILPDVADNARKK
jgi:hypothetical protein